MVPVGDHGWTYMHDQGRLLVESELGDKVTTTYIENVKYELDAERVMRDMAQTGHDIIFATSFGYMESMVKVAKEFPDVKFEHATGYKTARICQCIRPSFTKDDIFKVSSWTYE